LKKMVFLSGWRDVTDEEERTDEGKNNKVRHGGLGRKGKVERGKEGRKGTRKEMEGREETGKGKDRTRK